MKKFLSITLAISVLLSVFCFIPAEAHLTEMYPYLSLNFEENNVKELQDATVVGKSMAPAWKAGGANGTDGCLTLTDNQDYSWEDFYLAQPLVVGQQYRVSAWVRLNDNDPVDLGYKKDLGLRFLVYSKTKGGNSGLKQVLVTPTDKIRVGKWVLCSTTFNWDGIVQDEGDGWKNTDVDPTADMRLGIRFDSGVGDGTTYRMKLENKPVVHFDLDDIILEPAIEKPTGPVYGDDYSLAATFEDGTVSGLEGMQGVATDSERGKVGHGKWNSGRGSFATITAKGKIKVNHTYKISAWIKRLDKYTVFGGDTTQVALICNPVDRKDYTNLASETKYPTYTAKQRMDQQNKWFYFEWIIKYEAKTFDSFHPDAGLRIGNSKASINEGWSGEIGQEGVEVYVDDFLIQDLGIITNGDMETAAKSVFVIGESPKAATVNDAVFAWRTSNATASSVTDVPDGSESTKSMNVKINANGGKVYQGVNLENNNEYKVSFWAKGKNMADGETKPMAIAFDRKVNTVMAEDVYIVPDYETVGEFELTNEWQKFECTFDYVYETKSKPASANFIPRMPYMYVEVDGNKAGTEFVLDDFTLVDSDYVPPDNSYPYPYITSADVVAEDGIVETGNIELSYEWISETGKMEGDTIIRVSMSDDGKSWGIIDQIVADYGYAEMDIPVVAVGKHLKLEILPMDISDDGESAQMGIIHTIDLGVVDVATRIEPEFTKWDEANGEVAAKIYMEQNLLSAGDQNVVVILAVYDDDNTLIGTAVKPCLVVAGEPATVALSASIKGVEDISGTNAKLFVWSGTSIDDAGEKIFTESISYPAE